MATHDLSGNVRKLYELQAHMKEMKRRHEAVYSFASLAHNYHHHGEDDGMKDIHIRQAVSAIHEQTAEAELFDDAFRLLDEVRESIERTSTAIKGAPEQ